VPLSGGAIVQRWDMMGNRLPTPAGERGAIVPVTNRPEFVVMRQAPAQAIEPVAALEPTAVRPEGSPDEIRIQLAGASTRHTATFTVQPQLGNEAAGDPVQVRVENGRVEPASIRLTAAMHPLAPHADRVGLRLSHEDEPMALLMVPIRSAVTIPSGDPAQRQPDFVLNDVEQMVSFFAHDPANEHRVWSGPDDLSARVWLQLADDVLRLQVAVRDDRIHQPYEGREIFQGDSIQYFLQHPEQTGHFELGAAPGEGEQAKLHAWSFPAGQQDPTGRTEARVVPTDEGLRYELAIPLQQLGLTRAQLRQGVRFNLLVNDSDGQGRDGYLRLAPGIGDGINTNRWPMIRFDQ
jgi:hypothetical protein